MKICFDVKLGLGLALALSTALTCGCLEPDGSAKSNSGDVSKKSAEQLSSLVAEYRDLNSCLELTEQEETKIAEVHLRFEKKLRSWYDKNHRELRQIQGNALDAARERDLKKLKQMNARGDKKRVAELYQEERELQGEYEATLIDAIPAAKLDTWKSHVIAKQLLEYLEPIDLSDDQIKQIQESAVVVISREGTNENWKGMGTRALEIVFARQIVSKSQQPGYDALKKSNRLRQLRWNNH